eukprot:8876058-Alexandrium_andersonii.AAC.1
MWTSCSGQFPVAPSIWGWSPPNFPDGAPCAPRVPSGEASGQLQPPTTQGRLGRRLGRRGGWGAGATAISIA